MGLIPMTLLLALGAYCLWPAKRKKQEQRPAPKGDGREARGKPGAQPEDAGDEVMRRIEALAAKLVTEHYEQPQREHFRLVEKAMTTGAMLGLRQPLEIEVDLDTRSYTIARGDPQELRARLHEAAMEFVAEHFVKPTEPIPNFEQMMEIDQLIIEEAVMQGALLGLECTRVEQQVEQALRALP